MNTEVFIEARREVLYQCRVYSPGSHLICDEKTAKYLISKGYAYPVDVDGPDPVVEHGDKWIVLDADETDPNWIPPKSWKPEQFVDDKSTKEDKPKKPRTPRAKKNKES